MPKKNELTYEEAMSRLETLVQKMERGELPIDKMAKELAEAQSLIALCRKQLLAADEEIQKILQPKA